MRYRTKTLLICCMFYSLRAAPTVSFELKSLVELNPFSDASRVCEPANESVFHDMSIFSARSKPAQTRLREQEERPFYVRAVNHCDVNDIASRYGLCGLQIATKHDLNLIAGKTGVRK